jgi:hypothetical protein
LDGLIGDAVADYNRRVRVGEPYLDAVGLAEFTDRYLADEGDKP